MLGKVASAIGDAGGTIGAVDLVQVEGDAHDPRHHRRDRRRVRLAAADRRPSTRSPGARVLDTTDRTFMLHVGGKIELQQQEPAEDPRRPVDGLHARASPASAGAIHEDPDKAFQYTIKRNTVAVVSDGTAVLGLGDIGPRAAMPVMEGKAMLFKEFAGVDAFPICLDTRDPDEIVAVRAGDRARASAGSTSRTSRRRAASRSRTG